MPLPVQGTQVKYEKKL